MKILLALLLCVSLLLSGCDSLYASEVQANIHLEWTAVGDDGVEPGTKATTYDLRYTTDSTLAFAQWAQIPGEPVPSLTGVTDSIDFSLTLEVGTSYYFSIRACDEVPNCGLPSNVYVVVIPDTLVPGQIIDLRGSFSGVAQ